MKCLISKRRLIFTEYDTDELNWLSSKLTWTEFDELNQAKNTDTLLFLEDGVLFTFWGLYDLIKAEAKFDIELVSTDIAECPDRIDIDPNILENVTLLDFQISAIKKSMRYKSGINWQITGAGKSEMILGCLRHLINNGLTKGIIIVPSVGLSVQMYSRALLRGFSTNEIGQLNGGFKDFNSTVIIATSATIHSGLKREDPKIVNMIRECNALFFDETHHLRSASWSNIAVKCSHSEYILAFSGTPFNDNEILSNYGDTLIRGLAGPPISRTTHRYLRNIKLPDGTVGLIAEPVIYMEDSGGKTLSYRGQYAKLYDSFIYKNNYRNKRILHWSRIFVKAGFTTLILVQRIEHARLLMEMLKEFKVISVFGSAKSLQFDEFKNIVDIPVDYDQFRIDYENGVYDIAIMNQIGDEGFDLSNMGCVIMAGAGKSDIRTNQRIGRGVRRKKRGPNKVYVFDFRDKGHVYFLSQSNKRLKAYQDMEATLITDPIEFENMILKHSLEMK